jgi:WD40 repeat protein
MLDPTRSAPSITAHSASEFDVFVSYSRRNSSFCAVLERSLRVYKPPGEPTLTQQRLSVFRDTSDLVGADYFVSIDGCLRGAKKLIVICSPDARSSDYVNDEIRRFVDARGADNIIPIIIAGLPNNEANDQAAMAFPDALCSALKMPLAIDYRGFDAKKNKLDRGAYAGSWYTLIASILGRSREQIEERERKRAARARRITIAITSSVIAVLVVFLVIALWQWRNAVVERVLASARQLAAQSQLELTKEDAFPRLPALLAIESSLLEQNAVAHEAIQTSLSRLALPRVGTLALGRNRKVVKAVFSADAQYLALLTTGIYAGEPTRIELWQVPSTRQVATWDVAASNLAASTMLVSFSDDSRYLAFEVNEESSTTTVVEVGTGTILRQARRLSRSSVAWAGEGLYLLVAGPQPNIIRVYDEIADRDIAHITENNTIMQTAISSDGRFVVTVSAHAHVSIWRVANGTASSAWRESTNARDPVFSPDGRKLAITVDDKTVAIFNPENGAVLQHITSDEKILGVTFSPAAQYALAVEEPGRTRVWDLEMRRAILTVGGRTNEYAAQDITDVTQRSPIINVAFADDDHVFITARSDGVVSLWKRGFNAGFGNFGINVNDHAETIRVSAGRNLREAVLSPDGRYLMTTAGGNWMNPQGTMELADFKARLWDMSDGREIGRITSEGATSVAAVSAAGQLVATASAVPSIGDDGRAMASIELGIWRLAANTETDRSFLRGPGADAMNAMKKSGGILSLDGRRAAAATDDGLVLWDAAEGIRKIDLPASNRNDAENHRPALLRSLRFSADSKTLILTDARSALAFRAGDGVLIGRKDFDADLASPPAIDPHGRYAAVTLSRAGGIDLEKQLLGGAIPPGANVTRVWELATGTDVATIEHRVPTSVIALARDGGIAALASASVDPNGFEELKKGLRPSVSMRSSLALWDVLGQRGLLGPIQSSDVLSASAAFDDAADAIMLTSVAMVWATPGPLPVSAPSFSILDVRTGRQIAKPHVAMPSSFGAVSPLVAMPALLSGQALPGILLPSYGFGDDGQSMIVTEHVASANGIGQIVIRRIRWRAPDLARQICDRLPEGQRGLTADEIGRYMPGETYRPTCQQ